MLRAVEGNSCGMTELQEIPYTVFKKKKKIDFGAKLLK